MLEIKKLTVINSLIFTTYLLICFAVEFFDITPLQYLKALLGISIFLIVGFDCAFSLKKELKLNLDFIETLMVGIIISLFFIPLILFLVYKIFGTINEWLNFFVYLIISVFALIFSIYTERNANRKI